MIVRWGEGWAIVILLVVTMQAPGCLHRSTVSQDFGLPGGMTSQPAGSKAAQGSQEIGQQPLTSPDGLRAVFQQKAQGAFDPLVDDMRIQALQTRLKQNPQDVPARLELAGVYEQYRFYNDGLKQYAETLRQARSQPDVNWRLAEQAMLGLGRCARASGGPGQAIPLLEAALKEWQSASLWDELGLLYDESGELAAGERAFREAIALDPKAGRLHGNLGYNLLLQNKVGAAEVDFRRALELNPKSATSRNNLGVVLARKGDLSSALEQFKMAADDATAHNNLAVVLFEAGRYEQCRDELINALAIQPYFGAALANFKLVQERIRERAATPAGGSPDDGPNTASSGTPASGNRSPEKQTGVQSKPPEEKR